MDCYSFDLRVIELTLTFRWANSSQSTGNMDGCMNRCNPFARPFSIRFCFELLGNLLFLKFFSHFRLHFHQKSYPFSFRSQEQTQLHSKCITSLLMSLTSRSNCSMHSICFYLQDPASRVLGYCNHRQSPVYTDRKWPIYFSQRLVLKFRKCILRIFRTIRSRHQGEFILPIAMFLSGFLIWVVVELDQKRFF